jgi:two-component system, NtrC family, sensor kinase
MPSLAAPEESHDQRQEPRVVDRPARRASGCVTVRSGSPPLRVVRPRDAAAGVLPRLKQVLVPFADAVPWPAIIVDEAGNVLHLNPPMQQRGVRLDAAEDRTFGAMFPEYLAALSGEVPWLTPQDVPVTLSGGPTPVHERLWVRRLPKGACIIVSDETRLRDLEMGHAQTARLASLGFMLASVSHEIGNPLAAIHSMLQILQSKRGVSPDTMERGLANIAASVRRLTAISRKLNSFSRVGDDLPAAFAVDAAIEEAAALFGYDSLGEAIELVHHRDPQAVVYGHAGQLQQVFHNLFLNAAQAMKGRGTIVVLVSHEGNVAHVSVRDTGPGLPSGAANKVFEPFYTTKRNGEGTGLGLAISLEIIQEHQGTIRADTHAEGGAQFHVCLPLHTGDPAS